MITVLIALSILIAVAIAGPIDSPPRNAIEVPENCRNSTHYNWHDGKCREVWRMSLPEFAAVEEIENPPAKAFEPDSFYLNDARNMGSVKPNCPKGQKFVYPPAPGACRDVWKKNVQSEPDSYASYLDDARNMGSVKPNCPKGQVFVYPPAPGACREVWKVNVQSFQSEPDSVASYVDDARNAIVVPPNCPKGQKFVYPPGVCMVVEPFHSGTNLGDILKNLLKSEESENQGIEKKNIITVPIKCPAVYKHDANGICRPIF